MARGRYFDVSIWRGFCTCMAHWAQAVRSDKKGPVLCPVCGAHSKLSETEVEASPAEFMRKTREAFGMGLDEFRDYLAFWAGKTTREGAQCRLLPMLDIEAGSKFEALQHWTVWTAVSRVALHLADVGEEEAQRIGQRIRAMRDEERKRAEAQSEEKRGEERRREMARRHREREEASVGF